MFENYNYHYKNYDKSNYLSNKCMVIAIEEKKKFRWVEIVKKMVGRRV